MRYLVEATLTPERGTAIEAAGGPGPAIGYVVERFHPDVFYAGVTRRVAILVVELNTAADMAELTIYLTNFAGNHPTYTAVLPVAEAEALGTAIANVAKAPSV